MTRRPDPGRFQKALQKMPECLDVLGFKEMRTGQDEVVYSLLQGRDTIALLPTGRGKTACFILPSLALDYPVVIMSPLVSLIKDQVDSLNRKGLGAVSLSSLNTEAQNLDALKMWGEGRASILYCAPERLDNELFQAAMERRPPLFVVIDEAHVCSAWSDNFRPSYRKVRGFIDKVRPRLVGAFTATCPAWVESDIRRVFGLEQAAKKAYMPRRSNLTLSSAPYETDTQISRIISRTPSGSVIVYCPTIKLVGKTAQNLQSLIGDDNVAVFHGELSPHLKSASQEAWMEGESRVIVATNAFGMGIDKANVRAVIHRDIPGSIEALAQEIGRGGRDGLECQCVTLWSKGGFRTQEFFIECGNPPRDVIEAVYDVLATRADPATGVVHLSGGDIAQLMKVDKSNFMASRQIDAARHILRGSEVVEPAEDYVPMMQVTLIERSDDPTFRKVMATACRIGQDLGNHRYAFQIDELAMQVGKKEGTVRTYLRDFAKKGWIHLTQPSRATPLRVIGGLERVEFSRLREKSRWERDKLDKVRGYLEVPDAEKHRFLESYFEIA